MKPIGLVKKEVQVFLTPNYLRELADRMERRARQDVWGASTVVERVVIARDTVLAIGYNQDYLDENREFINE